MPILIVILFIFALILARPIADMFEEQRMKPEDRYWWYCQKCVGAHRKPASYIEWCKYHNIP